MSTVPFVVIFLYNSNKTDLTANIFHICVKTAKKETAQDANEDYLQAKVHSKPQLLCY